MPEAWMQRFEDLLLGRHTTTGDELDAGAQMIVTDPDGTEVFRAPLARMWRVESEDPRLIWVLPIVAEYQLDNGAPAFNLNITRRRGLSYTSAELDDHGDVVLRLRTGQTARIQPATEHELARLERWDTFFYVVLTEAEQEQIKLLDIDYWGGRFG